MRSNILAQTDKRPALFPIVYIRVLAQCTQVKKALVLGEDRRSHIASLLTRHTKLTVSRVSRSNYIIAL